MEAIKLLITKLINIVTADDLVLAFDSVDLKKLDYIFMCAAVVDYSPIKVHRNKIKKNQSELIINLKENPDVIQKISKKTDATIIVFALETDNGTINAKNKLINKNADYVILNYANKDGEGFNSNTNHVYVYGKDGSEIEFEKDRKDRIAEKIINWITG